MVLSKGKTTFMGMLVTTFARKQELDAARQTLDSIGQPYSLVDAAPGYAKVGTSAMVIDEEVRRELYRHNGCEFLSAGWVDYHPARIPIPASLPQEFIDDTFGNASLMVVRPCAADAKKLRAIAHLSGDLTAVFPYMNAITPNAFYNAKGETFTIMEGPRTITLYPRRIAIAKTDDIVDTWRVLEMLRVNFNECWARRAQITPSNEMRKKPAALEIYIRLPKNNCGLCGEKTCMAFALQLWGGVARLDSCKPVFEGEFGHLKEPLSEIAAGLGVEGRHKA
jgi:ArsR family metal-binding transcriptional regulator